MKHAKNYSKNVLNYDFLLNFIYKSKKFGMIDIYQTYIIAEDRS